MLDLTSKNSDELILFQDSKGEVWQIMHRPDLQSLIQTTQAST